MWLSLSFKTWYLNNLQNKCYTILLMKTWSLKKVNYFTVCDKYITTKQNQKEEDKNNKKRKRRARGGTGNTGRRRGGGGEGRGGEDDKRKRKTMQKIRRDRNVHYLNRWIKQ